VLRPQDSKNTDVLQVAVALVVIQTIADDEFIGNIKPYIVHRNVDFAAGRR